MAKNLTGLTQMNLLRSVVLLNSFFALLFRFADVSSSDSLLILLIVNIQISLGGLIWTGIRSQSPIDLVEFVGMGGAIGFGLSLISSQLFRTFVSFSVSWFILPLLVLLVLQTRRRCSLRVSLGKLQAPRDLLLIISGTLIALSAAWYWLVSTAVAVFLWTVLRYLRESNRSAGVSQSKWQTVIALAAVGMSVRAVLHLSALTEIRNPLWWNLRFGVLQDPDTIFAESMVNSTRYFGYQGNIFVSGLRFYYHWFAFAWEATLGSISQLTPFAVTAIAAPAIVFFVILCLVFTIARRISSSVFSAPAAMFSVAMLCAGQIPFFRILHPYSFSFNFGLLFLYALVVFVFTFHEMKRSTLLIGVLLVSLCLLGSKISFGPMLVAGIGFCLVWALLFKTHRESAFLLSIAGALAVLVSFTVIYKIGARSGVDYRISFMDILRQKANLENGLSGTVVFVTFLCVLGYLLAPATGLFFLKDVFTVDKGFGIIFSVVGGLTGIALGFVLSDPSETGAYFIQGGLALLVPVAVATLFASHCRYGQQLRYLIAAATIVCLQGARLWPEFYNDSLSNSGNHYYRLALAIGVSTFTACICVALLSIFKKSKSTIKTARILAILLLVSTVGSYYANAGDFFSKGQWAARNVRVEPADVISGSNQYRNLLLWLRDNSDQKDVIATNRYCSIAAEPPPGCRAIWSLTSAITGRQMLSEGTWTTNIISGFEDEAEKRRSLVENFVNLPTKQARALLNEYGVRWVVADYAVTNTRSWGEFAVVRFENKAGAILELVP